MFSFNLFLLWGTSLLYKLYKRFINQFLNFIIFLSSEITLNILWKAGLLVMSSLHSVSLRKSLLLKDNFSGYKFKAGGGSSLSVLFLISDENSTVILIFLLEVRSLHPTPVLQLLSRFSHCLCFPAVEYHISRYRFLIFILLGVFWASWTCG